MINLGNIEIADLRLGASQVKALYLGSEQVWSGEEPGPTADWLCFTAQQANSTVQLNKSGSPNAIFLETSTDGSTWTDYEWSDNTGDTLTLANVGDKVYMRAKTENSTLGSSNSNLYRFAMTGQIAASGNIQTLLKADGSRTDAPAYCYRTLFKDCNVLTRAPALNANTLTNRCYSFMFQGCSYLSAAPELPATTLGEACYTGMFADCTSLSTSPELPATAISAYSYQGMLSGCTSLTAGPSVIPVDKMAVLACQSMFRNCALLADAPVLSATTLADSCYQSMFIGCTSLTGVQAELPATTLAKTCYYAMFQGCTALTDAPALPATTFATQCYFQMFNGCTSLSAVDVSFTTWPSGATSNWLSSVAETGTFTCPAALPDTRGTSNIPEGWTKVDA